MLRTIPGHLPLTSSGRGAALTSSTAAANDLLDRAADALREQLWEQARVFARDALEQFPLGEAPLVIRGISSLFDGQASYGMGELERAERSLQRAIYCLAELSVSRPHPVNLTYRGQASLYLGLAMARQRKEKGYVMEQVLVNIEEARDLFEEAEDERGQINAWLARADLEAEMGQPAAALLSLQTALALGDPTPSALA